MESNGEADAKRPKHGVLVTDRNTDQNDDKILPQFMEWMNKEQFVISDKVVMTKTGSCARYGLLAKDDIKKEEVLFSVPRTSLLWEENCSISTHLASLQQNLNGSGWVKLILALMFEYKNPSSRWRPYMNFVPPTTCVDQPMFWSKIQKDSLLKGTGLSKAVDQDLLSIETEFNEIALPFIKEHTSLGFNEKIHNLDLYKHMVAFVMAYSFTEPQEDGNTSPPVMVPLADVLNHIAKNNAQLEFEETCLSMIAVKDIKCGEEIFNTYGQLSNNQLLHMYGFVEKFPNNIYDTVEVPLSTIYSVVRRETNSWPCFEEKVKWLADERNLDSCYPLAVGLSGILSYAEFKLLFKILPMEETQFMDYKENDDEWDTDDSDENSDQDESEFDMLSFSRIPKLLNLKERRLLENVAQHLLNSYHSTMLEKDTGSRECRAHTLVTSQCKILETLLINLSCTDKS